MIERDAFRLREQLRVRWAETDLQGIVFNGHYLTYFDVAIWRDDALITRGQVVYACADPVARRSMPIPVPLRRAIEAYEPPSIEA
jgi:acyl-CoA thioester hydrolase